MLSLEILASRYLYHVRQYRYAFINRTFIRRSPCGPDKNPGGAYLKGRITSTFLDQILSILDIYAGLNVCSLSRHTCTCIGNARSLDVDSKDTKLMHTT